MIHLYQTQRDYGLTILQTFQVLLLLKSSLIFSIPQLTQTNCLFILLYPHRMFHSLLRQYFVLKTQNFSNWTVSVSEALKIIFLHVSFAIISASSPINSSIISLTIFCKPLNLKSSMLNGIVMLMRTVYGSCLLISLILIMIFLMWRTSSTMSIKDIKENSVLAREVSFRELYKRMRASALISWV